MRPLQGLSSIASMGSSGLGALSGVTMDCFVPDIFHASGSLLLGLSGFENRAGKVRAETVFPNPQAFSSPC